jgi:hypothetical protein
MSRFYARFYASSRAAESDSVGGWKLGQRAKLLVNSPTIPTLS